MEEISFKNRFMEIFNIKAILGFLLWSLAIVFICVLQNMLLKLSFEKVFTKEFWAQVSIKLIIKYLSTTGSCMVVLSFYKISKNIKRTRNECSKWIKCKNKNFSTFIENEDRESKIDAWKTKQRKIINKYLIKIEKTTNEKKRLELKKKLEEIRETIKDDYIEKNFENIIIQYPRRLETSFLYADDLSVKSNTELDVNIDRKMNFNIFKGLFGAILFSIALSLIDSTNSEVTKAERIITLLTNLLIVLMASANGVKDAFGLGREYVFNNLLVKISIMQKFVRLEYSLDENDVDIVLKKIHIETEKKDLGTNLALQIQNGDIRIKDGKFLNNNGEIVAEKIKKENNS